MLSFSLAANDVPLSLLPKFVDSWVLSLSGPGEDEEEAPPVSCTRGGGEMMLLLRDEAEERRPWELPRRFSGGLISSREESCTLSVTRRK